VQRTVAVGRHFAGSLATVVRRAFNRCALINSTILGVSVDGWPLDLWAGGRRRWTDESLEVTGGITAPGTAQMTAQLSPVSL